MGGLGRPDRSLGRVRQPCLRVEHEEGVCGCLATATASPRPPVRQPCAQGDDRAEECEEQEGRSAEQPGHEDAPHGGQGHGRPGQPPRRRGDRRTGERDLHVGDRRIEPGSRLKPDPPAVAGRDARAGVHGSGKGERARAEAKDGADRPGSGLRAQFLAVQTAAVGRGEVGDGDPPAPDLQHDVPPGDIGILERDGGFAPAAEDMPPLPERQRTPGVRTADDVEFEGASSRAPPRFRSGAAHAEEGAVCQGGRGQGHLVREPDRLLPESVDGDAQCPLQRRQDAAHRGGIEGGHLDVDGALRAVHGPVPRRTERRRAVGWSRGHPAIVTGTPPSRGRRRETCG